MFSQLEVVGFLAPMPKKTSSVPTACLKMMSYSGLGLGSSYSYCWLSDNSSAAQMSLLAEVSGCVVPPFCFPWPAAIDPGVA